MTKSTKEGTGNKAPALFFYPDGVELPDYIYICGRTFRSLGERLVSIDET